MSYLIVDGKHFDGVERTGITYPLPSQIIPGIDYIKNAERSLGGRLHIDIADSKQTIQIIFDYLESEEEFYSVKAAFKTEEPCQDGAGLNIRYLGEGKSGLQGQFFVEDIIFNPLITDKGIKWRDVIISLLEI